MDCGFHFGFWIPLAGLRIPQTKITWIPDSGLSSMGRENTRTAQNGSFIFRLVAQNFSLF